MSGYSDEPLVTWANTRPGIDPAPPPWDKHGMIVYRRVRRNIEPDILELTIRRAETRIVKGHERIVFLEPSMARTIRCRLERA